MSRSFPESFRPSPPRLTVESPVTHRGCASSAAIVTGHDVGKVNWRLLLSAVDTIIILMGLKNLPQIMSRLIEGGCDPNKPVALIQSGTNISQKKLDGTVSTIASFAQRWQFHGATVIVVGEVVRLGKDLEWFQQANRSQPLPVWGKENRFATSNCGIDHEFIWYQCPRSGHRD
jgi:hypothetical protein